MGVLFRETVEEIPNLSDYFNTTDDFWPDDNFSDASQSMDELFDRSNSLGQDQTIFESLDEHALDEMAQEVGSDKAFREGVEGMPKLDSSDIGSNSSDGMSGYMAQGAKAGAGLLSGAGLYKAQAFIMRKISSLRSMPQDDDDVGVGLDELVDLDDLKNAAYQVSSESTRSGFGLASGTPSVGVESAA
jgi:hypothetical protein